MDTYITLAGLLRSVDMEQEIRAYVVDPQTDGAERRCIIDGTLTEYAPKDWHRLTKGWHLLTATDKMIEQACEDYYGARVMFIRTTDDGVLEVEVEEL